MFIARYWKCNLFASWLKVDAGKYPQKKIDQPNNLMEKIMLKNLLVRAAKLVAVFVLIAITAQLHAQYENGSLVGTIKDSTGAPIPGAAVTVVNTATSGSFTAKSDTSGNYEVPSLRVGNYTITASYTGFASAVANNITISVGSRARIDLVLKVGSTQTTVEVSGVALQLETDSSQRGQNISGYQTEAFPLVSRTYTDLLALVTGSRQAPTAATTSSITSLVRAGSYNVNGQRSVSNNFLLDGVDNNSWGESNQGFDNQIISMPPDSVSQFEVVTNNESAQYGRASGATINVASQSGTNNIHAILYEFIRNTDLNAIGFFHPTTGSTPFKKPAFNRNQFGGNVGGPILKNKLFAFLDYEGFRQTLTPLSVLTVPTQNEINGILAVDVTNPLTGITYPAGTSLVNAGVVNPISKQVLSYYSNINGGLSSLPVAGTAGTGVSTNDYAVQVPFTDKSDKGDLRLDWQQSPTDSYFLRVSDRKETGVNYPALPLPLDSQSNGKIRILDQQIVLGYTKLLGTNKVIDARLGLDRTKAGKYTLSIGNTAFSFPNLPSNAVVAGGLPSISISGGFTAFGRQSTNPQWQDPALIDPKVNYSWVLGKHSLKFGYEYEHMWEAVEDNNPLYGSFTFGKGYSQCSKTGAHPDSTCQNTAVVADDYWADFLFGTTSAYSLANYYEAHVTQALDSVYAQDDFKVLPKLTLNLGLRWEYGSPYGDTGNRISNFDPVSQTVLTVTPGAVSVPGAVTVVNAGGVYGRTLVNPDLADFAPRIGFSYAVLPTVALRGGFGTSYTHYTRAGSGDILAINAPQAFFSAVNQPTPTTSNQCPTNAPATSCFVTINEGFPAALQTSFVPATDNITYIPKNTRDSYVESYFLSVQKQLAKNTLLDIAYVGSHGVKLQGFLNANQENPANGFARPYANWPSDITAAVNEFWSHYDSLQARYEQRFVGGLTLLNSFTWENSRDNASASLEGNTPSPQNGFNIAADYGQSDYNLPLANVTSLVYDLPFGRGKQFMNSISQGADSVIGGWQLSLINTAQAGTPFNITYTPSGTNSVSTQISATYRGANEYRPDHIPNTPITEKQQIASSGYIQYINPNAFILPPTKDAAGNLLSPFGTSGRNPARTPNFSQTDLALNKKFSTPLESLKVEFRAEAYNIFNHTNFYLPSTIGGTVGTTTQTFSTGATPPISAITGGVASTGGTITSTFEPRILQFGLKVIY